MTDTDQDKPTFASDNASGVHPAVFERMRAANHGHALGYGADAQTQQALARFEKAFGAGAQAFLLCTGTAANVLALQALARSTDAVFCADGAHLQVDECGAPEHQVGCKIVPVAARAGKIELPALQAAVAFYRGLVHRSRPRVLSVSQASERGTVYTPDELHALASFAHAQGMLLHMDGARLANAAAALNLSLAQLTRELGVDMLSFGGTKNGLMMAEAIVVFDPQLAAALPAIRKQGMQLASKQRFVAAQYLAYFDDDLWLHNASQANRMAARLGARLGALAGVQITEPVQTNMVFATLPRDWIAALQSHTMFHVWNAQRCEVRLVTSFDSSAAHIDAFADAAQRLAAAEGI